MGNTKTACSSVNKKILAATVCFNTQIGKSYYRLGLDFGEAGVVSFGGCKAGQFAELDLAGVSVPSKERIPAELVDVSGRNILLRRPFSFADVNVAGGKAIVEVLYCPVGPASVRMTNLAEGDSVSVIGPLGSGFGEPEEKKAAIFVAGGMGAGPLEYLAKVIAVKYPDMEMIAFVGARSREELPYEDLPEKIEPGEGEWPREFSGCRAKCFVAADDGSAGFKGLVTECLSQWLDKCCLDSEDMIIYSCGPEVMLAAVAKIADEKSIECQVSMERRMACGIGLCQSCAVEVRGSDQQQKVYKLCCKDGPVFDVRQIIFQR